MCTDQKKRLVRRFYEEVVNTGNVDAIAEYISPHYVAVHNNQKHFLGLEGAVEHILGVRRTYSNLHLVVDRQIAEGDWVATQVTVRGIHEGSWLGIEPTHRLVEFTGVNIDRVVHGRIIEHGGAANMLEPLLEVGAIKV